MVKRFGHNGHPSGRKAWVELERMYGGKYIDERPAQILAHDGKIRAARRSSLPDIPDFIARLNRMWLGFEPLGDPRSACEERAALRFRSRDTLRHVSISLRQNQGSTSRKSSCL